MGWFDAEGKLRALFKAAEQGAATSVWAAVGPELEGVGGLYLEDCNQAEPFNAQKRARDIYRTRWRRRAPRGCGTSLRR